MHDWLFKNNDDRDLQKEIDVDGKVKCIYFNKFSQANDARLYVLIYGSYINLIIKCNFVSYYIGVPIVCVKQFPENAKEHHTDKFKVHEDKAMILRRGQTFKLKVQLAREYYGATDDFYFVIRTGERPKEADKTMVIINEFTGKEFEQRKRQGKWGFRVSNYDEQDVNVEINIPSDALVGSFDFTVESDDGILFCLESKCCILFNPWCKRKQIREIESEIIDETWRELIKFCSNDRTKEFCNFFYPFKC